MLMAFFYPYVYFVIVFFFFKQKTAYEMRISDWSSDVGSSDLASGAIAWLPTWKQMPSASAAWRAANSSALVSPGIAPNLDARLSLERSDDTRSRTHNVRSVASLVARMIFSSSSIESRLKVRTPCV